MARVEYGLWTARFDHQLDDREVDVDGVDVDTTGKYAGVIESEYTYKRNQKNSYS